ncbi:polyamine transporter 1 [Zopfia rhizophila CBS 207.26]|uniref:Polyamine transporter 1 n=1 Tax=Zopfia rhizophila CBS 207.26 TaxID=1314779 RepID=A0A6A6EQQ6_9PEZI|nr:polyamine transporter 1 [Zopfia rhizophila CBS 207.26]
MHRNDLSDEEIVIFEKRDTQINETSVSDFSIESSVVDFDGANDPNDPLNWPSWYKWSLVMLISLLSLIVNLAILMCAPATSYILEEFHSTNKLHSTILVSIWELGEVVGPFLVAPLSEIYGRLPVFHGANIMFILFSIAAANSKNMETLIAMRFFLGLSVASTVINPCIVGDIFREEQRGRALGIMGMIPFIAPVVGPTVGGFISHAKGWRWTFWLIVIIASPLQLLFLVLYRESYRVRILERKAAKLRRKTGNLSLRSRYELDKPPSIIMRDAVFRPLQLLVKSRVVLLVGIHANFRLCFGMILGVQLCGQFLDRYLQGKIKVGNGRAEHRLPPMILGSILVPFGVLVFGWTVRARAHWIVPIIFSSFVGFGFVANAISAWSYLVDAFGIYSASATAANIVLRNAASAALPLAGPALSERLGIGWGYTVLSLIGAIAIPISLILWYLGERMRVTDSMGRSNKHQ